MASGPFVEPVAAAMPYAISTVQPVQTIGTIGTMGAVGTVRGMQPVQTIGTLSSPVAVGTIQPVQTVHAVQALHQVPQHIMTRDVGDIPVGNEDKHQVLHVRHKYINQIKEKVIEVPVIECQEIQEDVSHRVIEEEMHVVQQATEPIQLVEEVHEHLEYENRRICPEHTMYEGREVVVEKAIRLEHEQIVPVDQPHIVELVKEVPQFVTQRVDKYVEKPVHKVREVHQEVPAVTIREVPHEVQQVVRHELVKEVPGEHTVEEVQRVVPKHEVECVTVSQPTEAVQVEEAVQEVVQIEYREIVRQVPKVEVRIVEKKVPKIEYQYVEKVVHVPHVVVEERIIEEPVYEYVEVYKKVPKAVYQYVDKQITKVTNQYTERIVHEERPLHQEVPREIAHMQTVELTTQVPKPVYQTIEKPIPVYSIEAQAVQHEVAVTVRHEQPVEVPVVQTETVKREVATVHEQVQDVVRQPKQCVVQTREEVVPVELMRQKAQYVPQVQTIELIKEEPKPVVKQIQKSIPKYEMQYITNKVKVFPKYMEHVEDVVEWDEDWVYFNGYRMAYFTQEYLEDMDLDKLILHANFLYQAVGFQEEFPFNNWTGDDAPVIRWILDVQQQYLAEYRQQEPEVQMVAYNGQHVRFIPKDSYMALPERDLKEYAAELFRTIGLQKLGRKPPDSSTHETEALLQYIEKAQTFLMGGQDAAPHNTRDITEGGEDFGFAPEARQVYGQPQMMTYGAPQAVTYGAAPAQPVQAPGFVTYGAPQPGGIVGSQRIITTGGGYTYGAPMVQPVGQPVYYR